ncbi:solute carrier family 2, facilitated glucose transporter member 6 isoform X1 [Paroedura picta]|uniref:solute carrier family 2, facilitated glucose transporter member 6 isoform X1 n=1 Tax=Paroedura picta TaxID=143630 RepID=UPI004057728B
MPGAPARGLGRFLFRPRCAGLGCWAGLGWAAGIPFAFGRPVRRSRDGGHRARAPPAAGARRGLRGRGPAGRPAAGEGLLPVAAQPPPLPGRPGRRAGQLRLRLRPRLPVARHPGPAEGAAPRLAAHRPRRLLVRVHLHSGSCCRWSGHHVLQRPLGPQAEHHVFCHPFCSRVPLDGQRTRSLDAAGGKAADGLCRWCHLCLHTGLVFNWRWLAVAGEVPVLLMVILLCFMPESPRFLISQGKEEEALSALAWLRGQEVNYWWEYEQIKDSVQEQSQTVTWAELRTPYIYKPVAITLLMRFLQQLCGVTPILVYLQVIFDSTKVILASEYDAVLVGAVRLVSVVFAASSMDRAGRKILLYASACIMLASNLTLGFYIHYVPLHSANASAMAVNSSYPSPAPPTASSLSVLPLIATMAFIVGYAMGWGPITWLLMGEVLPLKARGVVSGLCVLVSWLTAFALTKAFLPVKESFGLEVPFFFFSIICVTNLIFTKWLIPETKGRSLERIESYFRTGRKSFLESFRRHR